LSPQPFAGLRLLVLEDEFLIAMDVEQLCRDHGAEDVVIIKSLAEALDGHAHYDAAILDLMLGGESTIPFAARLQERGVPFIFASGYTEQGDLTTAFPEIPIVGKPYSGDDIVAALANVIRAKSDQG
jgi:CheY-like chemotaxis protein